MSLRFNLAARVETVKFDTGERVFVIDDFLDNPEDLVALARAHASAFDAPRGHPYPGPQLLLPDGLAQQIDDHFQQHCREFLGARHPVGMYARFSRVTTDPARLDARQRVCHRDDTGVEPGHSVSALVHYLFHDEALGGTVFFQPLMSPTELAQFRRDAGALDDPGFASRYGIGPGYMTEGNRYFRRIGHVPARWNRAIFYDGGIEHSGHICWQPERYLSGDGRLTMNAFFKHRNV
ncbi:DUF6445 family protein [Pelomonas sp. P8]|uniref:DUF6445 family protein n=2 Tax=Pelomonas cellulosilytica TaxID=2906762 RepID=A0ABS8XZN1_9BURK|nr:DUF6445 family protein [Pelomonas sp. P8]MCE4557332.1 DUF6445 family protein [Pelomonas sp. P8]